MRSDSEHEPGEGAGLTVMLNPSPASLMLRISLGTLSHKGRG